MSTEMVLAQNIREGLKLDLEGDTFADPSNSNRLLECELAEVIGVELETPECIRLDFEHGSVGFPIGHLLKVVNSERV